MKLFIRIGNSSLELQYMYMYCRAKVYVHVCVACIIMQDFVGIDGIYNSTLQIVDKNKKIYSIVGLQNKFLLHHDEFPENEKYEANIHFTFPCSSIAMSTFFDFSKSS